MNYYHINQLLEVTGISTEFPEECRNGGDVWWTKADKTHGTGWASRNDFDSFMLAQVIARGATNLSGATYIAIDSGTGCSPRFDVIELPSVGEDCSYEFNGDSYPCGKVATISKTFKKITTTEGGVFYRHKLSGSWLRNGTWSLVKGHISEQNPHF